MNWHLAQVNIGVAKYEYRDSRFVEFFDELERINVLADESPGLVWRYVAEDECEAGREVFDDESLLFNMSIDAFTFRHLFEAPEMEKTAFG